ncbi:2TM domain-containing protein [Chitinimonas naiadis]
MQAEPSLRQQAECLVARKLRLLSIALGYAAIAGVLLLIDFWHNGQISWAIWPLLGLGFALARQIGLQDPAGNIAVATALPRTTESKRTRR